MLSWLLKLWKRLHAHRGAKWTHASSGRVRIRSFKIPHSQPPDGLWECGIGSEKLRDRLKSEGFPQAGRA